MKFSSLVVFGALASSASAYQGIQSGPLAGSAYASNMVYDSATRQVFLTGNTYDRKIGLDGSSSNAASESSCFVTSVDIAKYHHGWGWAETFGDSEVLESCHSLGMINPTSMVLLGNSEPNGLYANDHTKMSGFVMALDKSDMDVTSGSTLSTSSPTRIPYPISVTTDGHSDIYVVALTSTDDDFASTSERATSASFPNWIMNEKYGTSFDMSVMKLSFQQNIVLGVPDGPSTLTPQWTKEFPVEPESNGVLPRVYIGGVLLKNDSFLVVTGSTRGLGPTYGRAVGDDEDGFITLLDPNTGELLQDQKSQSRIGTSEDDVITGICDNPNDPNSFYIVGATRGDIDGVQSNQLDIEPGSTQAFIKKVSVGTLHGIWTVQWGAIKGNAETGAYAMGCAVSGDTVYVAGNVADGAGMVQGFDVKNSSGGDDVWVARITDSGNHYSVNWLQQVGTYGDDRLARYGGVVTDEDGNAVLYGDTNGSMFRSRGNEGDVSDIFVMTVDKDETTAFAPVAAPVPVPPPVSMAPGNYFGFQSGASVGNAYASHIAYDNASDEVYLVGNTYDPRFGRGSTGYNPSPESSCFMAPMHLSREGDVFSAAQIFEEPDALESCRGLSFMGQDSIVMLGNSEPGGMHAHGHTKMTGFVSAFDKNTFQHQAALPFDMSDDSKIPYPISVVDDNNSNLYMVALTSTDDTLTSNRAVSSTPFPNWIENEKYGSSFDMSVMKVAYTKGEAMGISDGLTSLTPQWTREFPIDREPDGSLPRVYVGGMILKNNAFLIAAGSTRGLGEGYGSAEGDDEDGFVALLDLQTGRLVQDRKNQERIGSSEDDIITGICDNPNDPNSFYVVGGTKGSMHGIQKDEKTIKKNSLQAFVKKVNLDSLHGFWTVQWGAFNGDLETSAYALGCAVYGDTVYVAGNVEKGAGMVQGPDVQTSLGGDDVWVAAVQDNGKDYDVTWMHQIGSSGDESLARYGGIVADRDGNAIVYGDTTGSMFRTRRDYDGSSNDVFVMSLHRETGHHVKPAGDASGPVGGGSSNTLKSLQGPNGAVVAVFVVVLVLALGVCLYCRRRSKRRAAIEKTVSSNYRDDPSIVGPSISLASDHNEPIGLHGNRDII